MYEYSHTQSKKKRVAGWHHLTAQTPAHTQQQQAPHRKVRGISDPTGKIPYYCCCGLVSVGRGVLGVRKSWRFGTSPGEVGCLCVRETETDRAVTQSVNQVGVKAGNFENVYCGL